ncbi:hypothetical protein cypCar_00013887 [Cyprinus carpio]|nr:hypothetical protein cypCar_00013887 [Cyprinus carpio]
MREYEKELCNMILDCCAQQRTYEKFFGLLAGRFCLLKKDYMESFEAIFQEQYETIHRLETNKLRNVSRMFAHLLYTDSIPWSVLECVKMSEDTTTSSSRIFVKILFQELCAYMGLPKLNERLKDMTLQSFFEGLFPRDNPRNTRFAINFFTSIGLGGLTDELREHLKNAPKMIMTQNQDVESSDSSSSSSSSSDSSSSDSSSDSDSSDSDSSSNSDSSSSSDSSSDSDSRRKKASGKKKDKNKEKKRSSKAANQRSPLEERPSKRHENRRQDGSNEDRHGSDKHHRDSRRRGHEDESPPARQRGEPERGRGLKDHQDHEDRQPDSRRHKDDGKNSRADKDKDRCRSREKEPLRRSQDRSKSRERSRKDIDSRDSYRNSLERVDKENRHSDRYKESRRKDERSRDSSPRRHR